MRAATSTATAPLLLATAASGSPEQMALLAAASPSKVAELCGRFADSGSPLAASAAACVGRGVGGIRPSTYGNEAVAAAAMLSAASANSEGISPTGSMRPSMENSVSV